MNDKAPLTSPTQELTAGPIRMKFADGELRYLYVGDKEIVRRIYFAVRNGRWATASPQWTEISVHKHKDSFTADMRAVCSTEGVDYEWSGHIVGASDGTIVFSAHGQSGAAFQSNRIGLCILYGAGSLAGQRYETLSGTDAPVAGMFPRLIDPTLVAGKFNTLRYKTENGMTISTTVTGTHFDMEDQRNYGDSSYKAYAPLTYPYPNIPEKTSAEESVTISVKNPSVLIGKEIANPTVEIGKRLPNARIPKIVLIEASDKAGVFGDVNFHQEKFHGTTALTWPFAPSIHLLDDDVFMENVWSLPDQVETAHSYAPGAAITIAPIVMNTRWTGLGRDPRNTDTFGAAWSIAFVKELCVAGVGEARFAFGKGVAETLLKEIGTCAGDPIYALAIVDRPGPPRVDGFAIDAEGKKIVYLMNRTHESVTVKWHGKPAALTPYAVVRLP